MSQVKLYKGDCIKIMTDLVRGAEDMILALLLRHTIE